MDYGIRHYIREKSINDLNFDGFSDGVKAFVAKYFYQIRSYSCIESKYEQCFNICTMNKDGVDLRTHLFPLLRKYEIFYKINFSVGHIVQQDNMELRYLVPHESNFLCLKEAFPITGEADLNKFYDEFMKTNVLDFENFKLETSKSKHIAITNIKFYCYAVPSRALLNTGPPLDMGRWSDAYFVQTLQKDHHSTNYQDNLCAFRALAVFLRQLENPDFEARRITQREVYNLYREFRLEKDPSLPEHPIRFRGCYLPTLKLLCLYKKVNVVVFSSNDVTSDETEQYATPSVFQFQGAETCNVSQIIYRFQGGFEHTMYLIDYKNHCMLIKNGHVDSVLQQFSCRTCSFVTNQHWNLTRHEKSCANGQKTIYRQGVFQQRKPLHVHAKELGFEFPAGYENYPYKIIWDIETAQKPTEYVPNSSRRRFDENGIQTVYTSEHSLLSVGFMTNFQHESFQSAQCFVREGDSPEDEQRLMDKVVDYWEMIQSHAHEKLLRVFSPLLERLDAKITQEKQFEAELMSSLQIPQVEEQSEDIVEEVEEEVEEQEIRMDESPLVKLKEEILQWLQQIICIAFNGCKYDLNVVKEYLFPKLVRMCGEENISILKRGNSYNLISTPQFRFIDMRNFVPPSFSLEKFLLSFKAPECKGYFPYEAVHSVQDLNRTYCPPREAFTSRLKGFVMTEDVWKDKVQNLWDSLNMRTWRDFLMHYNLNDVLPFYIAITNYENQYPNADLFKTFVSVSGAAYYNGFKKAPPDDKFFLCNKETAKLMKKNIVGGFTSATTRHFKKDESRLRNEEHTMVGGIRTESLENGPGNIVGGVHGFDCNSMYLDKTAGMYFIMLTFFLVYLVF